MDFGVYIVRSYKIIDDKSSSLLLSAFNNKK